MRNAQRRAGVLISLARPAYFIFLITVALQGQHVSFKPVTVCEILKNPSQFNGKAIAVLGRLSSRSGVRSIDEEPCGALKLFGDPRSAPHLSGGFAVDDHTVKEKLKAIRVRTKLASFRFGTPDYDRWAIVYGRVKIASAAEPAKKDSGELIYAGDGDVILLADDYQ